MLHPNDHNTKRCSDLEENPDAPAPTTETEFRPARACPSPQFGHEKEMRAFTFDIPSVAAKLPDIEVYERKIGLRLPDDFREFCLTYNGGCPDSECDYYYVPKEFVEYKQEYESDGEEAYISVQELYGVHPPNDRFSTERVLTFLARFQGIPFEWIPVASDYCGNQVFLVAKEKVWAGVYFWDNETGLTFKIANSCGEFYDGLTNDEESQPT